MEFIVIYCTVPNKKEGREIARKLVERKLVACVNIIDNVESIFSWDGELSEAKEAMLMIKTKKELFDKIQFIISDMHSYNVPEIVALPIVLAEDTYLKWIAHETV
jgi:periplasmic divalent cation tolerance protein